MSKKQFSSPFPDLQVSEEDRDALVDLADEFLEEYLKKYQDFVLVDKRQINERHWKHIKTKDNLHVYTKRNHKEPQPTTAVSWDPDNVDDLSSKDLPVVLNVGTLSGNLDDLMLGIVNPTPDTVRFKSSYVHDVDSAAILCSVVSPSLEEPFHSVFIKWMRIDAPLKGTKLVKARDFVYMESTGVEHLPNGDRVGYQLLHSIEFPQTKAFPNVVRSNLSYFGCFQQLEDKVIDVYAFSTIAPGGDVVRFISLQLAAETLLTARKYVHCGQMKKLSWVLQHRQNSRNHQDNIQSKKECVMCSKTTSRIKGAIGSSTCKLCYGCVCHSCKIRERVSFIELDGKLSQRKMSFCGKCWSQVTTSDAIEAARHQTAGFPTYKPSSTSSSLSEIEGILV